MSDVRTFSSDELFDYLKILAKKFRKLNGKNTPAELYLVGGASILLKGTSNNPIKNKNQWTQIKQKPLNQQKG